MITTINASHSEASKAVRLRRLFFATASFLYTVRFAHRKTCIVCEGGQFQFEFNPVFLPKKSMEANAFGNCRPLIEHKNTEKSYLIRQAKKKFAFTLTPSCYCQSDSNGWVLLLPTHWKFTFWQKNSRSWKHWCSRPRLAFSQRNNI